MCGICLMVYLFEMIIMVGIYICWYLVDQIGLLFVMFIGGMVSFILIGIGWWLVMVGYGLRVG